MKGKPNNCPLVLRLAAVLFVLTLFSLCICSGLYARYTATAKTGDSARVAAFSVVPGESYTTAAIPFADMAPGDSRTYTFAITSGSEVAVNCSIVLSTTNNLPLQFKLDDTPVTPGAACNIPLAPNQGEITLNLTALWPESENDTRYLYEIDAVRLTVTAEQID